MTVLLQVHRLSDTAKLPTKAYEHDAGFDLYSDTDIVIEPNRMVSVKLGIAIALPEGWCMVLCDKSGLRLGSIQVFGVVDSGYRGELKALAYNGSMYHEKLFRKGDKVCQGLILPVPDVKVLEITDKAKLGVTERGDKGFGSSGV
jgi:dUTP pyrophosphatase